ncbi:MAG: SOS response-associated peptidase [Azospirillaceae bacterium]|nr:SOS response-associated peptidase [Azospirillaceae bacterium]
MCGRFSLATPVEILGAEYGFANRPALPPRYNITPTQDVAAVRVEGGRRCLVMLRWGLVPAGAADPKIGSRMINARAETLLTKAAFCEPFLKRRCLVLADGYYEWEGPARQPYRFVHRDGGTLAFAALWQYWRGPGGTGSDAPLQSVTIITVPAGTVLPPPGEAGRGWRAPTHDRMPAILGRDAVDRWLDPGTAVSLLQADLTPASGLLTAMAVSSFVNATAHEGIACLAAAPQQGSLL